MRMLEEVFVTGVGAVSPYGMGVEVFSKGYNSGASPVRLKRDSAGVPLDTGLSDAARGSVSVPDFDPRQWLGQKGLRVFDRLALLLLTAMEDLLNGPPGTALRRDAVYPGDPECAELIVGTSGPLESLFNVELEAIQEPGFLMPGRFPNAVFSTAASFAAIRSRLKGGCLTLANGDTSSLDAIGMGMERIADGQAAFAACGGVEELSPTYVHGIKLIARLYGRKEPRIAEGAAMLALEGARALASGRTRPLARLLAFTAAYCENADEALARNMGAIRAQCGEEVLRSITDVFLGRSRGMESGRHGFPGKARMHTLYGRVGYMNSVSGSMCAVAALCDRSIPEGSLIFIHNSALQGNASSLLMRKLNHVTG